jgi:hypothetical protein
MPGDRIGAQAFGASLVRAVGDGQPCAFLDDVENFAAAYSDILEESVVEGRKIADVLSPFMPAAKVCEDPTREPRPTGHRAIPKVAHRLRPPPVGALGVGPVCRSDAVLTIHFLVSSRI